MAVPTFRSFGGSKFRPGQNAPANIDIEAVDLPAGTRYDDNVFLMIEAYSGNGTPSLPSITGQSWGGANPVENWAYLGGLIGANGSGFSRFDMLMTHWRPGMLPLRVNMPYLGAGAANQWRVILFSYTPSFLLPLGGDHTYNTAVVPWSPGHLVDDTSHLDSVLVTFASVPTYNTGGDLGTPTLNGYTEQVWDLPPFDGSGALHGGSFRLADQIAPGPGTYPKPEWPLSGVGGGAFWAALELWTRDAVPERHGGAYQFRRGRRAHIAGATGVSIQGR